MTGLIIIITPKTKRHTSAHLVPPNHASRKLRRRLCRQQQTKGVCDQPYSGSLRVFGQSPSARPVLHGNALRRTIVIAAAGCPEPAPRPRVRDHLIG